MLMRLLAGQIFVVKNPNAFVFKNHFVFIAIRGYRILGNREGGAE